MGCALNAVWIDYVKRNKNTAGRKNRETWREKLEYKDSIPLMIIPEAIGLL